MSLPGHTPSSILREALLEYSRDLRRSRERRRAARRHRRDRSQPPVGSEETSQIAPAPLLATGAQSQTTAAGVSTLAQPPPEYEWQLRESRSVLSKIIDIGDSVVPKLAVLPELLNVEEDNVSGDKSMPMPPYVESIENHIAYAKQIIEEELGEVEGTGDKVVEAAIKAPEVESKTDYGLEISETAIYSRDEESRVYPTEFETGGCCSTLSQKYHVAHDLCDGDGYAQSRFIQKVFALISLKAFVLIAYLSVVELLDDFKNFYKDSFHYHFISLGIYIVIKITVRLTKNCRRRHCCLHVILHVMDIIALGDFLGCAMTHLLTDYVYFAVPRKILYSLCGTSLFFIYVGWFVAYDMRDGIMIGTALVINALTALHQVLHGTIKGTGFEPNMGKITDEWSCVLIVLGVSELLITIIMFELRSVLTGNRFSVWYSDWFFTGVYII